MKTVMGVDVLTTIDELADPARAAVLVVDIQNAWFTAVSGFEGSGSNSVADIENMRPIIPRVKQLLEVARDRGILVAYAEFIHRDRRGVTLMDGPNNYCIREVGEHPEAIEGTWEAQTVDELKPQDGDVVIHKSRGSAFHQTRLDDLYRARAISTVIVTGVLSAGCVLFTAAEAMHCGYYPLIVRDCVASYTIESHEQALAWMETQYPVFDSAEVLAVWENSA